MIGALLFVAQMSCASHAMGFSQESTRHNFRLYSDGGAIEVRATDAASLRAVRKHLRALARAFASGDFSKPQAVHDQMPDGAVEMAKLRRAIEYRYGDLESGGRVRIRTANAEALDAVHRFLRFQITEHQTSDSTEVTSPP